MLKKRLVSNQNTLPKRLDSIAHVTPLKHKVERPQPQVMSEFKPIELTSQRKLLNPSDQKPHVTRQLVVTEKQPDRRSADILSERDVASAGPKHQLISSKQQQIHQSSQSLLFLPESQGVVNRVANSNLSKPPPIKNMQLMLSSQSQSTLQRVGSK